MSDSFTIKVDGREIPARPGQRVLDAMLASGLAVPHYCYHQGLSVSGNCRACLVQSNKTPPGKLVIACATECVEGLEIDTRSPEVRKAQAAVQEFLLINHPLDCPVCDQAGECKLQDYAHAYGRSHGRFIDPKVTKPRVDLGPRVALWKQRCVACSRCIRFCDEISGTGELALANRGDRVEIVTFPGLELDNPLSGNVVDVCPVGALVSRDFLFQARVWMLARKPTVCPGCSRGCNIMADALDGELKRLVPRPNLEVNGYWMCDAGRDEYRDTAGDLRRTQALRGGGDGPQAASPEEVVKGMAEALGGSKGRIGVLASLWLTTEELHLVEKLVTALEVKDRVGVLGRADGERQTFPGFVISGDRNPNRAGARLLLGEAAVEDGAGRVQRALATGEASTLLLVGGHPGELNGEVSGALQAAGTLLVIDAHARAATDKAAWTLPGGVWAEKNGTFVNEDRRLQRICRAVPPPGEARPELEWLELVLARLAAGPGDRSAQGVFDEVARERPAFAGMRFPRPGSSGEPVKEAS